MNAPDLFAALDEPGTFLAEHVAVIAVPIPRPLVALRHHVTGAIERGEAVPVIEQPAPRRYACPSCTNTVTLLLPTPYTPRCCNPKHLRPADMKETNR